jgi:hypothetical protein
MNHAQVAVADHYGANTLYTHRIGSSLVTQETLSVARVCHLNDQDELFFADDLNDGQVYRINANYISLRIVRKSTYPELSIYALKKKVRCSDARISGDLIAGNAVLAQGTTQEVLCVRDLHTKQVVKWWDTSRLCLRYSPWSFNSQMLVTVNKSNRSHEMLNVSRFSRNSTFQKQLPYFVLSVDINSRNELAVLTQEHGALYLRIFDVS